MDKDFIPSTDTPGKIEVHAQRQIEKQKKLVGRVTLYKGHTLYEINCTTGDITKAQYETEAADYKSAVSGSEVKVRKVIVKENCLYVPSLNKKNAKKKFLKYVLKNMKIRK